MLSDKELFKGLTAEQAKSYRLEVAEKWGKDALKDSESRIRKMSPKKWDNVKEDGVEITKRLAKLMNKKPEAAEVQKCIADWHKWLENFYPVSEARLRGLGEMYVADERFTAHYEKFGKNLAKFKNEAIQIYCDNGMKSV